MKSAAITSPRFGVSQCALMTEHGNGSISAHHFQPTHGIAASGARIPEKQVAPVIAPSALPPTATAR